MSKEINKYVEDIKYLVTSINLTRPINQVSVEECKDYFMEVHYQDLLRDFFKSTSLQPEINFEMDQLHKVERPQNALFFYKGKLALLKDNDEYDLILDVCYISLTLHDNT